ncbi:MAG: hypothetical protein WD929_01100 [Steroidobacteraceae bacterium]
MEPQSIFAIAMAIAIAIVLPFMAPKPQLPLRPYWERKCAGRVWRRTFPTASNDDIYKAANPAQGWPDALELETLDNRLKSTYGIALRDCWSQSLTLGELFARSQKLVA